LSFRRIPNALGKSQLGIIKLDAKAVNKLIAAEVAWLRVVA
jgi:hypothetical protein